MARYFKVSLKKSGAGQSESNRRTLEGLALTRMGRTVYLKDTPAVRGMLYKVVHLVELEPMTGEPPRASARVRRAKQTSA
jgi:large subunit ribosomal protein L30